MNKSIWYIENRNVLLMNVHFDYTSFKEYIGSEVDIVQYSKNLDNIIFFYPENIPLDILNFMELLASNNISFICNSFCITLHKYFDDKYGKGTVSFPTLSSANQGHFRQKLPWLDILKIKSKDRPYLVKHFTNLRKINRDLAFNFLKENGFCNSQNLITFRGNNLTNENEYKSYIEHSCYVDFDYNSLNDIVFESDSQKNLNPAETKELADDLLFESHSNVMFDIVTESVHPYHNSKSDVLKNTSSVTKRIILPCLFKNVFHIYPKNEPLENWLLDNGFELYFKSDEDFLNNCNETFYLSADVQRKLQKNYSLMIYLYFEEFQSFLFETM